MVDITAVDTFAELSSAFQNGLSGGAESIRTLKRQYGYILENREAQGLLPISALYTESLPTFDLDEVVSLAEKGQRFPWQGILNRMQSHRQRPIYEAVVVAISRWRAAKQAIQSDPDLYRVEHAAKVLSGHGIEPGWHVERHSPQEWQSTRCHMHWYGVDRVVYEMERILDRAPKILESTQGQDSKEARLTRIGLTAFFDIASSMRGDERPFPHTWTMAMSHAMCLRRGWLTGEVEEQTLVERVMRPVRKGVPLSCLESYARSGDATEIIALMNEGDTGNRTRYTNLVKNPDWDVNEVIQAARLVDQYLFDATSYRQSFAETVFYRYPSFVILEGTK